VNNVGKRLKVRMILSVISGLHIDAHIHACTHSGKHPQHTVLKLKKKKLRMDDDIKGWIKSASYVSSCLSRMQINHYPGWRLL